MLCLFSTLICRPLSGLVVITIRDLNSFKKHLCESLRADVSFLYSSPIATRD